MPVEVELKFLLTDASALEFQLQKLGAVRGETTEQIDWYFNHPSRDFRTTGEVFRVRSSAREQFLTYKGPLLDTATRMRREIEVPLQCPADSEADLLTLLEQLGFRRVRCVRKLRTSWDLTRQGAPFTLAVDKVAPLGTYLEIEQVVEDAERETARNAVLALAMELKLTTAERRSYLQMLLEHDASAM